MLPQEAKEQGQEQENSWIRKTSQKILAIGAGLVAFLKFTDRIMLAEEACHEPDQEFIQELVQLLKRTEPRTSGDD